MTVLNMWSSCKGMMPSVGKFHYLRRPFDLQKETPLLASPDDEANGSVSKPKKGVSRERPRPNLDMVSRLFYAQGELCASHPWEVIVATLTLTVCLLTVDRQAHAGAIGEHEQPCNTMWRKSCDDGEEYNAMYTIVMMLVRCAAVLYSYYHFSNLKKLKSKYILGVAGLFTVLSSFIFSTTVINFMQIDGSDFKDALFFFLLLIDLSKATRLAQYALSSSTQDEVKQNIAYGLALLGPTITLDTFVEALLIGVGTVSGVHRLEVLCWFGCMSVIVNFIVIMTFYPACLSLILDLSPSVERPTWDMRGALSQEDDQKPNPVVQRVKMIMAAGLLMVHAHSRYTLSAAEVRPVDPLVSGERIMNLNSTDDGALQSYIMKWLTVSADQIGFIIILFALAAKFVLFENREDQLLMAEEKIANSTDRAPAAPAGAEPLSPADSNSSPSTKVTWEIDDDSDTYVSMEDKEVQTEQESSLGVVPSIVFSDVNEPPLMPEPPSTPETPARPLEECLAIYKQEGDASKLTDTEVAMLVAANHIPGYMLEKAVSNPERGVGIRRMVLAKKGSFHKALMQLPYRNYDYSKVLGACCENVIGYMPVPVGYAGPMKLDGQIYFIPLATTEGCLIASTNRGCRALLDCGINSEVVAEGMTRGPVVRFTTMPLAAAAMKWMQEPENFEILKEAFDGSSRFARLIRINIRIAGRYLFIRFVARTGDAMGMNMLSKGTELALNAVKKEFPDMDIISLSGNYCTDKKPAAVNWIEGRGKSVVCEAIVPAKIIKNVLKTTVSALVDVNISKNLIGSSIAGSIGGFNAHAANLVTAIYIATGQDPAQNIGSSNCMTLMEPCGEDGEDLCISCTMPSIEVGTIGGGTILPPQASCLEMLGVRGPHEIPGENASKLARIVCATVLAGELSLLSALAAGHLVRSHLRHNRSTTNTASLDFVQGPMFPSVTTQSAPSTPALSLRQCLSS